MIPARGWPEWRGTDLRASRTRVRSSVPEEERFPRAGTVKTVTLRIAPSPSAPGAEKHWRAVRIASPSAGKGRSPRTWKTFTHGQLVHFSPLFVANQTARSFWTRIFTWRVESWRNRAWSTCSVGVARSLVQRLSRTSSSRLGPRVWSKSPFGTISRQISATVCLSLVRGHPH